MMTAIEEQDVRVRSDRARAEAIKFAAETDKYFAEKWKLLAEENKFKREPWVATSVALASALTLLLTRLH
jgi:methionyl-tRNA synthetase